MVRENEYEEYEKFGVPKEVEMAWLAELKNNILVNLYSEKNERIISELFSRYSKISNQIIELLFMLEFSKANQNKWDSFTNVRIVESILFYVDRLDRVDNLKLDFTSKFCNEYKQIIIYEAIELLKNIVKMPFYISDSYKINGDFSYYITESKIMERIDDEIKYRENELKSLLSG